MRPRRRPPAAARKHGTHVLVASLCLAAMMAPACSPAAPTMASVAPTVTPPSTPTHAAEIRFGLVGELNDQNVWALFSGEEYSYNDYAVRVHYWPRLYASSVPEQEFEPRLAAGTPTAIQPEGAYYTASVPVRTDLRWSDGSAFTGQDVAFTVNAALQFELGFDWGDFYDLGTLDHAEALAPDSVKFFFTRPPNVSTWQLGALQGPIVQAEYWAPKVAEAASLLPTAESRARIDGLREKIDTLQSEVNRIYAESLTAQGEAAREVQANLRRQQGNLDEATNDLNDEQAGIESALMAARLELFQQDDEAEPLLGPWLPAESAEMPTAFTNVANGAYPGPQANFDQAVYQLYRSADDAQAALAADEINLILDPEVRPAVEPETMISPSRSERWLLFNLNAAVPDPAARRALACMLDQAMLAAGLGDAQGMPFAVPPEEIAWHNPAATLPCYGLGNSERLAAAIAIMKDGGYSWEREPSGNQAGEGLKRTDGSTLTSMRLLAPSSDEKRASAAESVQQLATVLGIPVTTQLVPADELDYIVLSSGDFDAAIVGWRVGAYPGHLCEWFGAGGIFGYSPSLLPSQCGELEVSSDLGEAQELLYDMQKALVDELPFIPLYSMWVTDRPRGITYPFRSVIGGLVGLYGAPELAIPAAP